MVFRDEETALRARLTALEREAAEARGLVERNRALERENAELGWRVAELERKLAKLIEPPPRPTTIPPPAAGADESVPPLTFRWRDDGGGHLETLRRPMIKIGTLSSSHLRLEDESVSRIHAVIEVQGSQIAIIDLGSSRGTRVNGKKVSKATLGDGDVLKLGRVEITIGIGG